MIEYSLEANWIFRAEYPSVPLLISEIVTPYKKLTGADMVIANSDHVSVIEEILNAEEKGTVFPAHKKEDFDVVKFIS